MKKTEKKNGGKQKQQNKGWKKQEIRIETKQGSKK